MTPEAARKKTFFGGVMSRIPDRLMKRRFSRPCVERLELRLPPGDVVVGAILAPSAPASVMTCELDRDLVSLVALDDSNALASEISRPEATPESTSDSPTAEDPSLFSADECAMEFVFAGRTAGVNPAARQVCDFHAHEKTAFSIDQRAAGLNPGVRSAPQSQPRAVLVPAGLPAGADPSARQKTPAGAEYGNVPLTFEANHGQTDAGVDFIARMGGATVFLTPTTAVFSLQNSESEMNRTESAFATQHSARSTQHSPKGAAIHMQIVGANPDAQPTGINQQPGIVNYFIGNDPNQWHANIPTFAGVQYDDVYPGIDLVYYSNNGQLEYDFIVAPGADPNAIALTFAGADRIEVGPQGDLVVHTAVGDLIQQKPYLYQETNGTRHEIAGAFSLSTPSALVTFEVGAYDATRPLVIDPLVMGYSTYLGGTSEEFAGGIDVDRAGNAYITGVTYSLDFPATPGAFDTDFNGGAYDGFITKLNAGGSALVYSTFLGGSSGELAEGIAVDDSGSSYIVGYTWSTDFPTTPGAFDTTSHGGYPDNEVIVTKLSPDGSSLVYSTYVGGVLPDHGQDVAVDRHGSAYIAGYTFASDFPTTPGSFDTTHNGLPGFGDLFVTKLNADGSSLVYSTFIGGKGGDFCWALAIDGRGGAYLTGHTDSTDFPTTPSAFDPTFNGGGEAYLTKLNPLGSALAYSTYLGGSGGDRGNGIAVDQRGNAFVTGVTTSSNYPTTPGAFDSTPNGTDDTFVTKLNTEGSSAVYSTLIGGSNAEEGHDIKIHADGSAYVAGSTLSLNFPTTSDAFDGLHNRVELDVFLVKFSSDGSALSYGTYLGGFDVDVGDELALDPHGNAYVTGYTRSLEFPTTPRAYQRERQGPRDTFVTKFAKV
jgi:hypothetical protein